MHAADVGGETSDATTLSWGHDTAAPSHLAGPMPSNLIWRNRELNQMVVWRGIHYMTQHPVEIRQVGRAKHSQRVEIWEKLKPICRTRTRDHDGSAAAIEFMILIAVEYASGVLQRHQLQEHHDEKIGIAQNNGVAELNRSALKRPAAVQALTDPSSDSCATTKRCR